MSNYLNHLIARSFNGVDVIKPRPIALFEPVAPALLPAIAPTLPGTEDGDAASLATDAITHLSNQSSSDRSPLSQSPAPLAESQPVPLSDGTAMAQDDPFSSSPPVAAQPLTIPAAPLPLPSAASPSPPTPTSQPIGAPEPIQPPPAPIHLGSPNQDVVLPEAAFTPAPLPATVLTAPTAPTTLTAPSVEHPVPPDTINERSPHVSPQTAALAQPTSSPSAVSVRPTLKLVSPHQSVIENNGAIAPSQSAFPTASAATVPLAPAVNATLAPVSQAIPEPTLSLPHPPVALQPHSVSSDLPSPSSSLPSSPPTIHVTIGRIEVRATPPAGSPVAPSRPKLPVMSLDEYLRQRSGGGR
ncbi:hypothetical protein IQ268_20140 [Oculatella sp. LEGE 06141]|uniref:hypothetical protein n=1 Tax=Oculatella sp. LEGE 06141 TaxID=1828648 RepID=UPI00188256AD|nr:hypothetical protein [Oculatella sp. LEGE 06141]MBE9180873.1 hypothetical protein [Oculatella sp. LEGE 06141]